MKNLKIKFKKKVFWFNSKNIPNQKFKIDLKPE